MRQIPEAAVERAMKIQEVILRAYAKKITWYEAAEIIGISCRQMRRWKERYEEHGYDGLVDRRRGQPSSKRVEVAVVEQVLGLYRDKYFDFNVRHFHEKLEKEHGIYLSYTWVKSALQGSGLVKREKKRGKHRKRRERRAMAGMLLHIDGSKHRWFGDEQWWDLIVIMDDATSEIYYAQLVEEESTRTVMEGIKEVIEKKGLFCSLYSDRASHFFLTPKAGEAVDYSRLTQVGRALKELGVRAIPAYSPQARGRSERSFGTWQGRLPQELRVRGITTLDQANRFLREEYIGEFNAKFSVKAREAGEAFVACQRKDLEQIFSIQHERVVAKDNTVSIGGRVLQIEGVKWKNTLAGSNVIVCEHLDKQLTIHYGPHQVGRYTEEGTPINNEKPERAKATKTTKAMQRRENRPVEMMPLWKSSKSDDSHSGLEKSRQKTA